MPEHGDARTREQADKLRPEVRLSEETIQFLEERMRSAVVDGGRIIIKELAKPENAEQFFGAFFSVMRKEAAQRAGTFVLSGIGALLARAIWVVLIGGVILWFADWRAVQVAWQAYRSSFGAP